MVFNQYSLKKQNYFQRQSNVSFIGGCNSFTFFSFFYSVIPLSTKTSADEKIYEIKNNKKKH